ncbi:flagellar filament capping protein FliD [Caldimonas thermodepolymerans]|uniref:flagellar filament capping protein FliD n=1 Tax=Caldimonas thermodepolymerans TaxID=215580 RepID=UPI0022357EE0|nr:flagellar filament capping protein FliD [Caldimonas thermodepolymerans]UZG43521.1 flagellar filament capping protein FliD [Caldimonas thermodepolymerans]
MAISSPGLGSGLDVTSIVEQLVALERQPIVQLKSQASKLSTQLSSFGLLQSYTSNLRDAAAQLTNLSLWRGTTATSSDAAVGVTSSTSATAGSYSIQVQQLAQAQSLASQAYADTSSVIGTGTLRFTKGDGSFIEVQIDGAGTLADIRDKVNAAHAGVSASIVRDAAGARLVFTATETGVANAVTIEATGDPGLQALAYDPQMPGGMTQTQAPLNALATINGLAIESASNQLSNVVEGLTLTLTQVTSSPVQVKVALDTESIRKAIDGFVRAYNDINSYIATQTKYDEGSKTAGTLQGDRATLTLQNQLRTLLRQDSGASAMFPNLSSLGLEVQRDGSLSVNSSKLSKALENIDELARAFANLDEQAPENNGFAQRFRSLAAALTSSEGLISTRTEGLKESIKRNEDQQNRLEDRVALVQQRLLRQYTALDASLSSLNSLANYVSQQVTAWSKTNSK